MGGPSSPKNPERGTAPGKASPDAGTGINGWGSKKKGAVTANGGSNTLAFPTSRKRLSDTSAVSTVTSSYQNRGERFSSASQEDTIGSIPPSPRQEVGIPTLEVGSGRTWAAVPSLRGLKYVDSSRKGLVMTPRTAAYICRVAQESGPTTARSMRTATTVVVDEELTEQARSKVALEKAKEKTEVEKAEVEVLLPTKAEPTVQQTPRVRRHPWTGPSYTAVHKPPYTPQTWGHERIENLLDPALHHEPVSWTERCVLMNDLERVGPREWLSLTGRPHYHPYPYRAPAAGSYLEDYPVPPPLGGHSFEKDALLRSVLTPHDNLPHIREQATYQGQPLNYMHSDWMLDNVMITTQAQKYCPGTTATYADIPNFGRVQSVFMRQPDGTMYPLVTLPKMTPCDIFKVVDKMKKNEYSTGQKKQRSWYSVFCCRVADTVEI